MMKASGDAETLILQFGYLLPDAQLWRAITACLVHFNLLHLVGNVFFLLAFGDAVEQRVPRLLWVGCFLGLGAFSIVCEGFFHADGVIAGASGGVSALMGAAAVLVLRPRNDNPSMRAQAWSTFPV